MLVLLTTSIVIFAWPFFAFALDEIIVSQVSSTSTSFGKVDVGLRILYASLSLEEKLLSTSGTQMQYGVGANMSL